MFPDIVSWTRRTCEESGVPLLIADSVVLARVALLLRPTSDWTVTSEPDAPPEGVDDE